MMKRQRRGTRDRLKNQIKICRFCEEKERYIDFKKTQILTRFTTDQGKIIPRRITGTCPNHQKLLRKAIIKARMLSLMR